MKEKMRCRKCGKEIEVITDGKEIIDVVSWRGGIVGCQHEFE